MTRWWRLVRCSALVVLATACAGPATSPPPIKASDLLVWRDTSARGESVPVFDSSAVYFLEQGTHAVTAVDRNTGVTLWKVFLQNSVPAISGYGLTIAGGLLVVGDMDVFGLDRATGQVRWKFVPTVGLYPGYNSLTSDGTTVYCGSTTGHVYAVDGATGNQVWVTSFNPQYTQVFAPVLVDGVVFIAFTQIFSTYSLGGAAAFDARSGQLLWRTFAPPAGPQTLGTWNDEGVAVTPTMVVLGAPTAVYGLDRTTGTILVTVDAAVFKDENPTQKVIRYTGTAVVVGNSAPGTLTALDPKDLHPLWQAPGDGAITALSADDSRTYAGRIAYLDVYRTSDGVRLWRLSGPDIGAGDELYLAAPAFDATHIYVAGTQGVYAFKKQ